MNPTQNRPPKRVRAEETTDNPRIQDFWEDMNRHRNAEYRKVGDRYVIEHSQFHSGRRGNPRARIVVWEAVQNSESRVTYYVAPSVEGNQYEWDAIGELWGTVGECGAAMGEITGGVADLRHWCQSNPYGGPRTPHNEAEH